MAGLLDSNASEFDPNVGTTIQGLLAQVQPSDADRAAARKQAQLQFFLGLLGATKGTEFATAGQAGQQALLAQQQYLNNLQRQKLGALQIGGSALDLLNKQFLITDSARAALNKMEQRAGGAPTATTGMQQATPPKLSAAAQSNPRAAQLVSGVLRSGDQAKIDELRRLGWLQ